MRVKCDAMKKLVVACLFLLSAAPVFGQTQSPSVQPATKAVNGQTSERLSADTPKTTVLGNAFVAPQDWSIRVKGPATILQAPEGDSWVALVDVQATGPDEALAAAWQASSTTPDRVGPSLSKICQMRSARSAAVRWP